MVLETTQFFDAVFQENLSLREFLASDWTMLNPRLAMHYGMPALKGTSFQKVKLRPEDHRGGIAHAGVDPVAHLRRHPPSAGASRRVGVGSDLRPNAPAPAAECRTARADAQQQAESDDPHATGSPRDARDLRVLPPEDRPARLRVRQLRRHRPLANAGTGPGRQGRRPARQCQRRASQRPGVRGAGRVQAIAGRGSRPLRRGVRRTAGDLCPAPRDDDRRCRTKSRRSPPPARRTATSFARSSSILCCRNCSRNGRCSLQELAGTRRVLVSWRCRSLGRSCHAGYL